VNSMRLSLMKAAHADVGGAAWQEIRVAHRFRSTGTPHGKPHGTPGQAGRVWRT
jgi:hypothetical protein